ncbi:armadillo-type protein [Fimicolochytrium jonesii]|uniref:armadillo-type protein n=1 Tax=Fimicolochytrium jonesii TaxID=1396493 RepID=UPI0022FE9DB6|nr:armadillo-type protein [Fimicolochytrium jonesii]KAI8821647.1 armadillo-type protein [Fimicolochytrium jonesii]
MLGGGTMEQTVLSTLSGCLSQDSHIRKLAEQQLEGLASQHPDYPKCLASIVVTQTYPFAERQLSAVTLRKYVGDRWTGKVEQGILGVTTRDIPEEVKSSVRNLMIRGIADPTKQIRVISAYVVAQIAHFDFPEAWPNLFDYIIPALRSGDGDQVHGAMRVLAEFVRDDLTDTHFPYIAPALLPELHRIFADVNTHPRDRSRALAVFRDFSAMIYTVSEEHPNVISLYLDPVIPRWMATFKEILSFVETPAETVPVKHEILRTLCKLLKQFPKLMATYITEFLEPIWNHLVALQPQYVRERVNPDDDVIETEDVDSDGEILGFESLLYSLLEFMQIVAKKRHLRHFFSSGVSGAREAGQLLPQLVGVCLTYLQITAELQDTWVNDMNQYIQDDSDEALTFNIRIAAEELLMSLAEFYSQETLQAISHVVQAKLQESTQARAAGDVNWWKVHEACLLSVGRVSDIFIDGLQQQSFVFDMEGFFNHVVLADMRCNECPFLQGRSLWLSSRFAEILSDETVTQYMTAAVEALGPNVTNPAVKISAVKALQNFCGTLGPQSLIPFQAAMIQGIVGLTEAASDEVLALLLETLEMVIQVNKEITAQYVDPLTTMVLHVWNRNAEDYHLSEVVVDLFSILASNEMIAPRLQERMIPALRDVLQAENVHNMPSAVATALSLMTDLIKNAPEPFAPEYRSSVFPQVIMLLHTVTEDQAAILQNGQDTIRALVQRDFAGIAKWSHEGHSGLDLIVAFIAKLCRPNHSESAGIFVGDLINALIQKAGNDIMPVLPQILDAVLQKLAVSKTPSFIQQLVLVFANLFIQQTAGTLDFLSSVNVSGKSGLEIVLTAWAEQFTDFQGFLTIKLSAIGLTKVFETRDPRLNNIMVKGDEIVTSNKIVTRSMSQKKPQQFSIIPFPAKAIKLILVELQHQSDSQMGKLSTRGNYRDEDDGDEEGSWDDEDESEEWEDDFIGADPVMKGMMGDLGADELENLGKDNAEASNDPVYKIDLKAYLTEFLRTCAQTDMNSFSALCEQYLNGKEKEYVRVVLSG